MKRNNANGVENRPLHLFIEAGKLARTTANRLPDLLEQDELTTAAIAGMLILR